MRRRSVLAGVGVALASLAGCSGDSGAPASTDTPGTGTPEDITTVPDPSELDGHVRPDADPERVPDELVCEDDDFERKHGWAEGEVQWGNLTDADGNAVFALRVDSLAVERDEDVVVTMTNVSDTEQETANIHKSDIEVYTEAGWEILRGSMDSPIGVQSDLWVWAPGESHTVTFRITDREIIEDTHAYSGQYVTCPDPPLGRYRFVTAAPEQGDVAVAFDLTG